MAKMERNGHSIFGMAILDILLIQVYNRSGTTHRFVTVVFQILIVLFLASWTGGGGASEALHLYGFQISTE